MQRIDVPYIDQSGSYPTGCESVSAVMLLKFLGYELTVDDFIAQALECRNFETREGELYGPDPCQVFCGSPYDEASFGCYSPVICRALNRIFDGDLNFKKSKELTFLENRVYEAVDETGKSMEYLKENYLDKGMPVVFWACINMREPIVGPSWRLLDTGEIFTWISNEHCMLLVGYDAAGYWFNDPYENNGVIWYEKNLTERRHEAQHCMAVGIRQSV